MYEKNDAKAEEILKISDAINFVFVLLAVVICIITYSHGSNLSKFFNEIKGSYCGDDITNSALYLLGEQLESNIRKNWWSMFLYILTIIIIPLNLIIMHFRSNSDQLQTPTNEDNYIELKDVEHSEQDYSVRDTIKQGVEEEVVTKI
jgi:hypothetical protein